MSDVHDDMMAWRDKLQQEDTLSNLIGLTPGAPERSISDAYRNLPPVTRGESILASTGFQPISEASPDIVPSNQPPVVIAKPPFVIYVSFAHNDQVPTPDDPSAEDPTGTVWGCEVSYKGTPVGTDDSDFSIVWGASQTDGSPAPNLILSPHAPIDAVRFAIHVHLSPAPYDEYTLTATVTKTSTGETGRGSVAFEYAF